MLFTHFNASAFLEGVETTDRAKRVKILFYFIYCPHNDLFSNWDLVGNNFIMLTKSGLKKAYAFVLASHFKDAMKRPAESSNESSLRFKLWQ